MASRSKFVYSPKPGDEVKWPNGLVMSYDDTTELIHVSGVPEDDVLMVDRAGVSSDSGQWAIGVTE